MTEENVQSGLGADTVKDVSGAVQDLIGNLVSNLTSNDKPRPMAEKDAEPRLFFPNGIELIDVTVSVAGVNVHVEVAGANGRKGLQVREGRMSIRSFGDDHFVEATAPPDEVDVFRRDLIVWENHGPNPMKVHFDDPCLNANDFTLEANSGQRLTHVLTTVDDGDYYYTCSDGLHIMQGNPKIVIQ